MDSGDLERVLKRKWHYANGYACDSKRRPLHELILGKRGRADHRNRNRLDYRRANLRSCSQVQNIYNRGSLGGTSRFKGVSMNAKKKMWEVSIGWKNKTRWIGYFDDEVDAAIAYNVAAQIFHGEFAFLNPV